MRKDPTDWRNGFRQWKETGKLPWKAGKRLPKFEGGNESVRVGDYNVYPSAIGASELDVTTPEVVVTGKDRRPLYQRYDAEHSTYDPKLITNFTGLIPGVGDIQDATMAVDAYNNKDYLSAGMLGVGLLLPNVLEKAGKYAVKTGLKYFPEATKSAYDIFHLYKTPKDNPRLRRYADDVVSLLKSDEMQARGWISSDRYLQQINNIQSAPAYFTHSRHTFIRPQFKLSGKEFTSPIPLPDGYRGVYSPNKHSFTVSRGKHTPDEIRHTAYHEASHASDRGRGTTGYMSIEPKENSLYYGMPTEKRARVISILTDAYKNGININDITELGNFINKNYINSNYSSLLKNYKTTNGKSFISNMLYTP